MAEPTECENAFGAGCELEAVVLSVRPAPFSFRP